MLISVKPAFGSLGMVGVLVVGGDLLRHGAGIQVGTDSQCTPERPSSDGEGKTVFGGMQPSAAPRKTSSKVRDEGPVASGDHSQECRPAIRLPTSHTGAQRLRQ